MKKASSPKVFKKLYSLPSKYTHGFGTVESIGSKLKISYIKNGKVKTREINLDTSHNIPARVRTEIQKLLQDHGHKIVATSFKEKKVYDHISSKLWLHEDTVSFAIKDKIHNEIIKIEEDIRTISSQFDKNNTAKVVLKKDNEVDSGYLVSLQDYKGAGFAKEVEKLLKLVEKFKNKKLIFINSTAQGGGVAIMRHALMRLFALTKADIKWYVLKPNLEAFNITKRKFHNILQAVSDPKLEVTEKDKRIYNQWTKRNADFFKDKFEKADVIVIDDPQPCGLIPYIKKVNPKAKIIYRSHIQIEAHLADKKGTPQYKTWQFLWNNIKHADLFVSHPVAEFVPKEVPEKKLIYMPATTDPLDGLNKPLDKHHLHYYLHVFDKFLKTEKQSSLDHKRPYIIQVARFDPSKGIPYVLESYLKLTHMLKEKNHKIPQLVITGNGSIDDPDRNPIFEATMKIVNSPEYRHLKNDIKVVRLPHLDQLLNALLRESKIALQLSTKEGFEIKVTEALMKAKPVIAYRTGGIPLQIKDGINGFLVKVGNTDQVAKHLYDLLTDKVLYERMSKDASDYYDRSLLTIPNAIKWLELSLRLLKK